MRHFYGMTAGASSTTPGSSVDVWRMWRVTRAMSTTQGDVARGWVPDVSTFGARLALVRQRMGWNIKEAAEECGLPVASWRNWEAGKQPRDLVGVCRRISDRTGAQVQWLVFGSPSRQVCSYFPSALGELVAA